jgi:hypothetical protein
MDLQIWTWTLEWGLQALWKFSHSTTPFGPPNILLCVFRHWLVFHSIFGLFPDNKLVFSKTCSRFLATFSPSWLNSSVECTPSRARSADWSCPFQ